LLHGWPDSFVRYHKVVPLLANPGGAAADACDVVVPSLPGFAFTGPVELPSIRAARHSAAVLHHLMTEVLGYERFAVAGGDIGSVLAQILAIDHPQNILGIHLTDLGWHVSHIDPSAVTKPEQRYLEAVKKYLAADEADGTVLPSRQRNLAAVLNDSPIGLASWIVDRFHSWSDAKRNIDGNFSKDDLLTNVMLYWATQTIGTSMSTSYADRRSPSLIPSERVEVPVGLALFPKDVAGIPPRRLAERTLNVARWTEMPRGGHLAALDEPALYAADVQAFLGALRPDGGARKEGSHDRPTV
jgi:pimeloyl-ACP methyl ester carboxylesterase